MFSTNTKLAGMVVGAILLASGVLTATVGGSGLAAVITGVDSQVKKCIQTLPAGKGDVPYDSVKSRLNTDSTKDIILTATGDKQCGSAGCIHELCLIQNNTPEIISFGYAADTLVVKDTASNGMYDIQLQGKSTTDLQWDGERYIVQQ